jgi:hypothetical protein
MIGFHDSHHKNQRTTIREGPRQRWHMLGCTRVDRPSRMSSIPIGGRRRTIKVEMELRLERDRTYVDTDILIRLGNGCHESALDLCFYKVERSFSNMTH